MDDVIADFQAKERRVLRDGMPPDGVPFYEAPGFFADLEVIADSQQVIRELAERYEVFIATAAMDVPSSFADKYAWLRRHFPFIPQSHYVFCGDKSVLDVDVLIDDQSRHFARFPGRSLLFSAPQNAGEQGYERVGSWQEVRRLLLATPRAEPR